MKKIFAILLCLSLIFTMVAMTSCKEKTVEEPPLDEAGSLIKSANEKMKNQAYKEVEKKYRTMNVDGVEGETVISGNSILWVDGSNLASFLNEESTEPILYYYDGSYYDVEDKKKCAMDFGQVYDLFASMGYDEEWFASFKFKEKTVTENADGTTTVQGKKADESAKEFVSNALAGSGIAGMMECVFDSMEATFTFDSEGRIIKHVWSYKLNMGVSGYSSEVIMTHEITYTYGDQYKVVLPADAGSYTAVDSFDDMFN